MPVLKNKIANAKNIFSNNKKVAENYFFMTSLQIAGSLIGLLIYPYVIRTLGTSTYGLYVFANSVVSYFIIFISFGFTYPALKAISQNPNDVRAKNEVVSCIFTAKVYMSILALAVYGCLLAVIPLFRQNIYLFAICFAQIIPEILFPQWYFQGVQKMNIVTYIQVFFRVLTIPFIFIFVKKPSDLYVYAIITVSAVVLSSLVCVVYMRLKENISFYFVSFKKQKKYFQAALPFFLSNSAGTIKEESVTLLIGSFFNMHDVALYDLANKIISIPRMFTMNINKAIFPKFIQNIQTKESIKKIIRYEAFIGFSIMLLIAIFGYWAVLFVGEEMLLSYPLSIILSSTIIVWLVVGCYINYIFIPQEKYYYVTRNQLVAFFSFFLFCIPTLFIFKSIYTVVLALALSGFCEILYCKYIVKKNNYL